MLTENGRFRRNSRPSSVYNYLDVTHPKANKGEVVSALSALLTIPTTQIVTIGHAERRPHVPADLGGAARGHIRDDIEYGRGLRAGHGALCSSSTDRLI